jgi:hypothetical protein
MPNNNNNNNNNNNRNHRHHHNNNNKNFTGTCHELNGHIYDCGARDLYVSTTEAIAYYFGMNTKVDYGSDIVYVMNQFELPNFDKPNQSSLLLLSKDGKDGRTISTPIPAETLREEIMWKAKMKIHEHRKSCFTENISKLYFILYGQCTKELQGTLMCHTEYTNVSKTHDGLGLLRMIRNNAYNYQSHLFKPLAIQILQKDFYTYEQGPTVTTSMYHTHFQNLIEVIEDVGGSLGYESDGIIQALAKERGWDINDNKNDITDEMKREAKEAYLATIFIVNADPIRYGKLIIDLQNSYLCRQNKYPKTIQDAFRFLTYWKNSYDDEE